MNRELEEHVNDCMLAAVAAPGALFEGGGSNGFGGDVGTGG